MSEIADQVADELGNDVLLKLSREFATKQIYVPSGPVTKEHPLRVVLGDEDFQRLQAGFQNIQFRVPAAPAREERDQKICEARKNGISSLDLAIRFNLTQRRITAICKANQ